MSEKLYHMAVLSKDGRKDVFADMPLDAAVNIARYASEGWVARAKSGYEWSMPDGRLIAVERAEDAGLPFLKAVGMFDRLDHDSARGAGDER